MIYAIIVIYGLFFLMCYLGTGTTEKNMKSFHSYPEAIQEKIRVNDKLSGMIPKKSSYMASFVSNYVLFTVVFSIVGLLLRIDGFWNNLWYFLIMGIGLNLFDLLVIDILWWCNTKRIRFEELDADAEEYKNPKKHFMAFLRGVPVFICVAVTVSILMNYF